MEDFAAGLLSFIGWVMATAGAWFLWGWEAALLVGGLMTWWETAGRP